MSTDSKAIPRAVVPWSALKLDVALAALSVLFVMGSLWYDLAYENVDFFPRSGAVMVLLAAILAYRGLAKYWIKAEKSIGRGYWLRTSKNQSVLDFAALLLSLIGTVIWGYGDKLLQAAIQ